MKKIILFLAVLTAALLLFGCGTTRVSCPPEDTTAAPVETTAAPAETTAALPADAPAAGEVVFAEGNAVAYAACIYKEYDKWLLNVASAFAQEYRAAFGASLKVQRDTEIAEREVILGYAPGEAAVEAAYRSLGYGEWKVDVSDTRIVFAAWDEASMKRAVEAFFDGMRTLADGRRVVGSMHGSVGEEGRVLLSLDGYSIVYSASASASLKARAASLAQALGDRFGTTINVFDDTHAIGDKEIRIGKTNRNTSDYIRKTASLEKWEWGVYADGDALVIGGGSDFVLAVGAEEVVKMTEGISSGPTHLLLPCEPVAATCVSTDDERALADGADVRIMSYNLLHESWAGSKYPSLPVEGRVERFASALYYYMPDVIGIQEVSSNWHKNIDAILADGGVYAKAAVYCPAGRYNMSTFLYNAERVRVVRESITEMDAGSDIRLIALVEFELIETGKHFLVTNCHPDVSGGARHFLHEQMVSDFAIQTKRDNPTLSLFMTGDFNTGKASTEEYRLLTTVDEMYDSRHHADAVKNVSYNSTRNGGYGGTLKSGDNAIDHIFIDQSGTRCRFFNMLIGDGMASVSDHIAIYGDYTLR